MAAKFSPTPYNQGIPAPQFPMAWKQIKRSVSNWSLNLRVAVNDDLTSMEVYDPAPHHLDEEPTQMHLILPTMPSPGTPKTPKSMSSVAISPFTPSPVVSMGNGFNSVDIKRNLAYIPKKSAPPPPSPPTPRNAKLRNFFKISPKPLSEAPEVVKSMLQRAGTTKGNSKRRLKGRAPSLIKRSKTVKAENRTKVYLEESLSECSFATATSFEEERTLNVEKPSIKAMAELTLESDKKGKLDPGSPSKPFANGHGAESGPPMQHGASSNGNSSDDSFNFFENSSKAPGKKTQKKRISRSSKHGSDINWGDELAKEMVEMLERHRLQ